MCGDRAGCGRVDHVDAVIELAHLRTTPVWVATAGDDQRLHLSPIS